MEFLAREKEVKKLLSALRQPDYELILVYGRRHVGKTELVNLSSQMRTHYGRSFQSF